ncbi:hypothetical protein BU23DRAFT_467401 [Bimuria novae-zelandiae CBS 107.79]|uniref:Uncharacterized protein n=1 Tax=Bimuria novae-zelandiae CBS 107.79 TaxID=1447943 RepID=A0A6A5V705_9PLEO|nr:hypothetical protein BU23DRAFT_467401 [Bimuria novae-zelandiae CBS 107.79]
MSLVPTGLATTTEPVSLSKFVPRIENLPDSCQAAYTAPIEGCTRDDFPANRDPEVNNCSAECVNGLVKIVKLVNAQCATVRVPATSIIGKALLGDLIPVLCGKIVVVTEQPSSTQAGLVTSSTAALASTTLQAQSSSAPQSSSKQPQATDGAQSGSSAPATMSTQEPPTSTIQTPGLTLDTATPPPPPPPNSSPVEQKSNPDSGGGSPFDVTLASTSSSLHLQVAMAAVLGVAGCILLFT